MFILRDYQHEARTSIFSYFDHNAGNPLVVAPTASGKSIMIADLISTILQHYPTERIVVATHVKELVEQNHAKFCAMVPFGDIGIYSAGLKRSDTHNQIIFASIQSIYKQAVKLQHVDLLLVDEAHMIPAKGSGMWLTFITQLKQINPDLKVIGYTATPFRMDSGSLTKGDGAIFTDIAYEITIPFLIEQGYLCEPIPLDMEAKLDVSGVKKAGGEFVNTQLDKAVNQTDINERVIAETLKYCQGRKKWMVFCVSVDHCHAIDKILKRYGKKSAVVTGKTPRAERDKIFEEYKKIDGDVDVLVNVSVATTGFDAPATDLLVILRPTGSAGLWIQILGRGMRISPETGKENCLVLDFGENCSRHGPIDIIKAKDKKVGGEAPVKVCPDCCALLFAGVLVCKHCGHIFPEPEIDDTPNIQEKTDEAPILSTQEDNDRWLDVNEVFYSKHEKKDKPPSLLVQYKTDYITTYKEWIPLESPYQYLKKKANFWWHQRSGNNAPQTVDEALKLVQKLKTPIRICVGRNKNGYMEVMKHDLTQLLDTPPATIEEVFENARQEMPKEELEDLWNEFGSGI